ncbi:MAG: pyruvate synthase [Thermoprotei archaeon]
MKDIMTGNEAAAWGARLAEVDYVPIYPITPQTEIVEKIASWAASGQMKARVTPMESEHSMLTAAGLASLSGARVFTATSSQGLVYAFEMLYKVAGWRSPMVMVNVSRALSSPGTLLPDHNDVLSARDTGFMQFHAETVQDALDSILIAYRVSEDRRVMLPSIVNLDGFYLSYTREPLELPAQEDVRAFLPPYPIPPLSVPKLPSFGILTSGSSPYLYFKYQVHLAQREALRVLDEAASDFHRLFGRKHELAEGFMLEDAEYAIVCTDSFTTIMRRLVREARHQGIRLGLLKLWVMRPFPAERVADMLSGKTAVAVFDQDISPGLGGAIYQEVAGALYGIDSPPKLLGFVDGLGGKVPSEGEMDVILKALINGWTGQHLLMSASDLHEVNKERMILQRGQTGGDRIGAQDKDHQGHPFRRATLSRFFSLCWLRGSAHAETHAQGHGSERLHRQLVWMHDISPDLSVFQLGWRVGIRLPGVGSGRSSGNR